MPPVTTVLFTLCGFATLWSATTLLGFGLWVLAPTLMLLIIAASLRLTQLQEIAKATSMAAGVLTGIFVAVSLVVAAVRGSVDELRDTILLVAGLACLCVLGILIGRSRPPRRDPDDTA